MKIDKLELLKKGWSASEIENAGRIIDEAETKKHVGIKFLDKSVFWAMLFLLIIMNVVCSIFIARLLFIVRNYAIDIIVALVGFIFGVLFTVLIADIEKLDKTHHQTLIIVFVLSGVINFGLLTNFIKDMAYTSALPLVHNAYVIGAIYLTAFLIPYVVFLMRRTQKQ